MPINLGRRDKGPSQADLGYPLALDVDLFVVPFYCRHVRPFKQAKADPCLLVVKEVDMGRVHSSFSCASPKGTLWTSRNTGTTVDEVR